MRSWRVRTPTSTMSDGRRQAQGLRTAPASEQTSTHRAAVGGVYIVRFILVHVLHCVAHKTRAGHPQPRGGTGGEPGGAAAAPLLMGCMILFPAPRAAFAPLGLRWKISDVSCAFFAGVSVVMTR